MLPKGPAVTLLCPCRYLFWTEWGQYPRIERSRLDGTERMVLVNVSISWPNGISVDYEVCVGRRGVCVEGLEPVVLGAVGPLRPLSIHPAAQGCALSLEMGWRCGAASGLAPSALYHGMVSPLLRMGSCTGVTHGQTRLSG